ncbi:MAG: hypothetical protein WCK82_05970 [Bacteroidota bacterium]
MKKIFTPLFLVIPILLFSQVDSTEIYFKSIENEDLKTICDLSDIQITKIICKDTLLKNKVFNLVFKEYKKGKITSVENLNISNFEQRIPFIVNGDTMIYVINMVEKAGFGEGTDSLVISLAGIYKDNIFKLNIQYPGLTISKNLKGKKDYQLREVYSCFDSKIKIPIKKEYPILAYTPPFDTGSSLKSYCMLGDEKVELWYEKFKLKHYYAIYIEIK